MSFGMTIMLVCGLVLFATRRGRWERRMARWGRMGPMGGPPPWGGGWSAGHGGEGWQQGGDAPSLRKRVEEQQALIETLESRLLQMEERLDFTERLLSGRKEERV